MKMYNALKGRIHRPHIGTKKWILPLSVKKYIIGLLLVFFGLLLGVSLRRFIPVAIVNGKTVDRAEFTKLLLERSGETVLQEMIAKQLLYEEADKKNITVSEAEINKQIEISRNEIKANGVTLEAYLSQRNYTMEKFREEIRDQLVVKKMFEKGIRVTESDIETFFKANNVTKGEGAILASQRITIKQAITQYLLRQKYYQWVQGELKSAEIVHLIKI